MEKKRKRNYAKKRRKVPPHRRNNLSASVSRPRERLCMIYSRIRRNTGAREREREMEGGGEGGREEEDQSTRRRRTERERERERENPQDSERTGRRQRGGISESDSLTEDRINRVHEVSEEVTWLLLREQLPLVICLLLSQSSCRSFCCPVHVRGLNSVELRRPGTEGI
ncbi:hypothetical protein ALC53_08169 [Atta colombica]|uniref:Uncharacterized protein n=1 Tax=Atta colombica TaxID=520822 RepID=A0A195BA41_9HYME|nr:hypothetical protein ALC53_08169 [Atta colombica]